MGRRIVTVVVVTIVVSLLLVIAGVVVLVSHYTSPDYALADDISLTLSPENVGIAEYDQFFDISVIITNTANEKKVICEDSVTGSTESLRCHFVFNDTEYGHTTDHGDPSYHWFPLFNDNDDTKTLNPGASFSFPIRVSLSLMENNSLQEEFEEDEVFQCEFYISITVYTTTKDSSSITLGRV